MKTILCSTILASCFIGPALGQTPEDYLATITNNVVLAEGADVVTRRDNLVDAAYAARRIVEDTPDSALANLLVGTGVEVFGADPIQFSSLQASMIQACAEAPNTICLIDSAYVVGADIASDIERKIIPTLKQYPTIGVHLDETYRFRSAAAFVYSELDLNDRVMATFNVHRREDGKLSPEFLSLNADDFNYALARIGQGELADRWNTDIDEGLTNFTRPKSGFYHYDAPRMKAAGLVSGGGVLPENIMDDSYGSVLRVFKQVVERTNKEPIIVAAEAIFEECLSRTKGFKPRRCAQEMSHIYGFDGNLEAAIEVINRPMKRPPSDFNALAGLTAGGHVKVALDYIQGTGEEENYPSIISRIGVYLGPDYLVRAAELTRKRQKGREGLFLEIAMDYARIGDLGEARSMLSEIEDRDRAQEIENDLEYYVVLGMVQRGEFSQAAKRLLQLSDTPSKAHVQIQLAYRALSQRKK